MESGQCILVELGFVLPFVPLECETCTEESIQLNFLSRRVKSEILIQFTARGRDVLQSDIHETRQSKMLKQF